MFRCRLGQSPIIAYQTLPRWRLMMLDEFNISFYQDQDADNVDALPDLNLAKEFYAKYDVRNVLGRGISSTVRLCIEKSTRIEYAVKIIDLTSNQAVGSETKSEINVLRSCVGHTNIIGLHDTFESNTFMFLVFEFCKNGELFDFLTEAVVLNEREARRIMRQLLEAVEFIHSRNIVHRDLKPENILLDSNYNIKISDFGFAVTVTRDDQLREMCGTPSYMSPETYRSSMYDNSPGYGRPADIWAAGVILYTILLGVPPFWSRRSFIMVRNIMEGKYPRDTAEWEDLSFDASDLLTKMLDVEPDTRITASECLSHPFFKFGETPKEEFKEILVYLPRRKFKAAAFVVIAVHRMRVLNVRRPSLTRINLNQATFNPYEVRPLRRLIDTGAFKIYGHWVKRGENQNRATLYETCPRRDTTNDDVTRWT